jgi:hypothetical protein
VFFLTRYSPSPGHTQKKEKEKEKEKQTSVVLLCSGKGCLFVTWLFWLGLAVLGIDEAQKGSLDAGKKLRICRHTHTHTHIRDQHELRTSNHSLSN